MRLLKSMVVLLFVCAAAMLASSSYAQGTGNSGSIQGIVTDPTGAVVVGATVEIQNPVSGFTQTAVTDGSAASRFPTLPITPIT